jgi:hypothetical protein
MLSVIVSTCLREESTNAAPSLTRGKGKKLTSCLLLPFKLPKNCMPLAVIVSTVSVFAFDSADAICANHQFPDRSGQICVLGLSQFKTTIVSMVRESWRQSLKIEKPGRTRYGEKSLIDSPVASDEATQNRSIKNYSKSKTSTRSKERL